MADLQTAVADLQAAVGALGDRINAQVGPLQAALAEAQQALVDFQEADATEDAGFQSTIDELNAALAEALGNAQAAADSIEGSVGQINALAQPAEPTA